MTDALKPCPFCGATLLFDEYFGADGGWFHAATEEDAAEPGEPRCIMSAYVVRNRPPSIARWNRRPAAVEDGPGEWRTIDSAPKNVKLIAAYRNALGKWRIVTACYHTQLPWSDDYDWREGDGEFSPPGWYEESDSSETIYRTSETPSHWRKLPAPPSPTEGEAR